MFRYERRWPFGDVIFAIVVNKGNGGVSFYNTTEDVVANADKVVAFLTSRAIVSLFRKVTMGKRIEHAPMAILTVDSRKALADFRRIET